VISDRRLHGCPDRESAITERPKINPRRIAYFGDNRSASTLVEVKGLVDRA
jgi:hypothetical protein